MLLMLFLVFIAISLIFLFIGFGLDIVIFALLGSLMLFGLGIGLLDEPLQYKVAENIDLEYGTNLSASWSENGGAIPSNVEPYVFSTDSTNEYEYYDDASTTRYGWSIAMAGVFAFCLALFKI